MSDGLTTLADFTSAYLIQIAFDQLRPFPHRRDIQEKQVKQTTLLEQKCQRRKKLLDESKVL
jgi:hypothetical protein